MAALKLRNIHKTYSKFDVIHGIDLDVESQEFVVFIGPSGCGKSTLLRMIAGLEDISSGDLFMDDERANDLAPAARGVAMVFQSYALYPHMTVYENMAFGLKMAKMPKAEIDRRVREAARILQIEALLDRRPRQLSGGQRQRVAIGRAIGRDPKIFLFDEPLSNLDTSLRVQMRIEIGRLHRELNATMIYVTHDQVEAMTLADKIVALRAGKVEQIGKPLELYKEPANKFVAGFIGSPTMTFLDAHLTEVVGQGVMVALADGTSIRVPRLPSGSAKIGDRVTLGLRPEMITMAGDDADVAMNGVVQAIERLGSQTFIYSELPDGVWATFEAPRESRVRVGEQVPLRFASSSAHLFGANEQAFAPIAIS